MLSEMFNFAGPGTAPAAQVIAGSYRIAGESFLGHRQGNPMAAEAVMQLSSTHASSVVTSAPHLHHQAFPGPAFSDEAPFSGGKGGLSLTLASSLHEFEMVKVEDLRLKNEMLFFDDNNHDNNYHQREGQRGDQHPASSMGMASSRYARAARELLEELCSLGRGRMESSRNRREHHHECEYGDPEQKDVALLAPADRAEHQRRMAKLLSMLDEVERRYNHYCDQMQAVVTSFDAVMGFGAATPYTRLAQKAMSRHFRCLRDAVVEQLRQTCELLGDREGAGGGGRRSAAGITKGETPRLKLLDRSLRQRRAASSALGRMGIMEQDAWRPQRGLPERSVGILRAWLFEHFLHPYPSDADKHLLARQAGLSRNQVSNWFINARVRLWKPMVEVMYQQDAMEEEHEERTPSPPPPPPLPPLLQHDIHSHGFTATSQNSDDAVLSGELGGPDDDDLFRIAEYGVAGNVSLTLGLRHGSNPLMKPEKEPVFF